MAHITDVPNGLTELCHLPVPSLLSLLLGYDLTRGNRRYIGVARTFGRPTITVSDGDDLYECPAMGWDAYRTHRATAPHLARFDFGDVTGCPVHMFIIDRRALCAYAGSIEAATSLLERQLDSRWRTPQPCPPIAMSSSVIRYWRLVNTEIYNAAFATTVDLMLPDLHQSLDAAATHTV
jgi:hypothetical protein